MKIFKKLKSFFIEYGITLVCAVIIGFLLKTYVISIVNVNGTSMLPNFQNNNFILTDRIRLYMHDIKRGDIIIFNSHDINNDNFIKRVIGLAGDTIEIKGGQVYLNGKEFNESYLDPGTITSCGSFLKENEIYKVPDGCIFALGDNRKVSYDSRYLGPINISDIKGIYVSKIL